MSSFRWYLCDPGIPGSVTAPGSEGILASSLRGKACLPAVLPGVPDVLQLAVPHVGHGEDEKVLVRVHTFPKL